MKQVILVSIIMFAGVQECRAKTDLLNMLKSYVPEPAAEEMVLPEVPESRSAAGPDWVALPAGRFLMGSLEASEGFMNAIPAHKVLMKAFEMSRTDVTVEQYARCVSSGRCAAPTTGGNCNWGKPGRQRHPVNCVSWEQANQYAKFIGARLPTEAEWEYAATSGGRGGKYPWGDENPTCENAVMLDCALEHGTSPVCSKPAGNTAQGLCDMAGNVWQWTQDKYGGSYAGVPADGSAFEAAGVARVVRGGSWDNGDSTLLRSIFRHAVRPGVRDDKVGFRVAR